jgi:hypothetical protein
MTPDPAAPTSPGTGPLPGGTHRGHSSLPDDGQPPEAAPSPWAIADTPTVVMQAIRSNPLHPAAGLTGAGPTNRRRVILVVGVIAVLVVLAAIGTAFAVKSSGTLTPIVIPSGAAGASPTPAEAPIDAGVYQAPGNLCDESDFTRLRPTFDRLDSLSPHGSDTSSFVVVACDGETGNETVNGTFAFEVQVSVDPAALSEVFDEDRAAATAHGKVTPIAGAGTRAYSYTQTGAVGLTVKIYDANLIMSLSWTPDNRTDQLPPELSDTLIATCQSNLLLFRRR